MTMKVAVLLEQFGDMILSSMKRLKETFEKRLGATEESLKALRQEFIEKQSSSSHVGNLSLKVDSVELQSAMAAVATQIKADIEELNNRSLLEFDARVKAFNDAALGREAAQSELLGQMKLLTQERARPTEEIVRGVVDTLRADHHIDEARVQQLIADATKNLQPVFELAALAREVAALLPSEDALAAAAARKVEIPAAPNLSGFVTIDVVKELLAKQAVEIDAEALVHRTVQLLLPSIPSTDFIAEAVGKQISIPDVSQFVTAARVDEMLRNATPDVEAIAGKAAALLPVAPSVEELATQVAKHIAAPDLSSFATLSAVQKLLDEHTAVVPVELDLEDIAKQVASHMPKLPEIEVLAAAAAKLVATPVSQDVSMFLTEKQVTALIETDREKFAPEPIDPEAVATRVVKMLPAPPELKEIAAAAAALIPAPKDGKSFTITEVQELIEKALAGVKLPSPQEVSDVLESTHLAKWELDFERRAQAALQSVVDRIPVAQDGQDGMGFDDQSIEHDGERTFTFVLTRGERRKTFSFKIPAMIYRGIYNEQFSYDRGDVVTWGGSSWIGLKAAPQGKPGQSNDWQLIVKKGRDGQQK